MALPLLERKEWHVRLLGTNTNKSNAIWHYDVTLSISDSHRKYQPVIVGNGCCFSHVLQSLSICNKAADKLMTLA